MVSSISADIIARRQAKAAAAAMPQTGFLIFDTESVPDGGLLHRVKYPQEILTPEQAIERAQAEAREQSQTGSDFLPVTFQVPVAVCVLRVATDYSLQGLACLDAPHFRTAEIVRQFWRGVGHYKGAKLVTFNGRGFDLPLLELAAFDHGCSARDYFYTSRNRFFVFLRTRVLMGELTTEVEQALARRARIWLGSRVAELPALATYLEVWDRAHP
jgi:hypothetical protein